MSYKKDLKKLYYTYTKDSNGFNVAAKRLQETYPGNYTIEEYFNPNTLNWDARLKFLSEEDEVWFKLKYEDN